MTRGRTAIPAVVSLTVLLAIPASAQKATGDVQAAWDNLLRDAIPKAAPDPVLTLPQEPVTKRFAGDFLNHFFFESRSEYWHADTDFSGLPTLTGLINAPFTPIFNPNGYPFQAAFQPDANRFYTFWDWGTRGWGSDRVDSHFSLRYRTDLTNVNLASPNANILETFHGDRQFELLTGAITINGRPSDGAFAGTSLELGRQHVYGAEVADLDGASFNINRKQFSFNLFGGRRFTYYSDPDQRAIGGGGLTWRPDARTSVSYDALVYIRASQRVTFRRRISDNLTLVSFFRAYGAAPVDLDVDVFYQRRSGRSSLRAGFFQKLTNRDYSYDFTEAARDRDPHNRLFRLYFGPVTRYSQVVLDARHNFKPWLTIGGSLWVRQLNDNTNDQGPFNNSFRDYRVNAQIFPVRKLQTSFEYHQHNTDRLAPDPNTTFDDVSRAGETSVKDLTGEVRRSFGDGGRLTLSGGAYYRRIDIQDRFLSVKGAHQSGWLSGAVLKADHHTRVFFDYALDNDFFIFRPDTQKGRILRVGLVWRY